MIKNNVFSAIAPYPGAKNRSADKFIPYIDCDNCKIYIEPFGGTYGVGLQKPRFQVEVYNDLNPKLALLMRILSNLDTGYQLIKKMIADVSCTQTFFDEATAKAKLIEEHIKKGIDDGLADDIERAFYIWSLMLLSINGASQCFKKPKRSAEDSEFKSKMLKKCFIPDKLNGLTVLSMDALELISEHKDNPEAFLFIDPPYPQVNESSKEKRKAIYENELLCKNDQKRFLETLKGAKAKILVCSYGNELYDKVLCGEYGWNRRAVANVAKSMSVGGAGRAKSRATEIVYINYKI